eukprot:TRINITY_DN5562_c0_g1_i1.p1 TRINITY_DN5562_c0_g1~~TRINITY_DN5562_c0_g1_i1.p1  ORF type:complete len:67 (-),score=18.24 TRINITY_DN5562_c0_g1_i1:97-297(-)
MFNSEYKEAKSPESQITDEDDHKHDIDNKAKRLDDIDKQIKVLEEELTELTNKSFSILALKMGQSK